MGWKGCEQCRYSVFVLVGAVWTLAVSIAFAQAETTEVPENLGKVDFASESLPVVVVVGNRASLASAQEVKKNKIEIVDSVVADDINKLPDVNVTDALSRVTGVQILRDRGEGAGVAIRGLTQMETTMNGCEIFTAGTGRSIDFTDIPSEMLAGIDVYKTSSAEHIEGGVGGLVDLRTRRPFDFSGSEVSGSVQYIYGDLVNKGEPQVSLLANNRWKTAENGELGLLVNLAHQKRAWREDQKSSGNPVARTDIIAGQTVIAPNGISETTSVGVRERNAADVVLQWQPSAAIELYAEANYTELRTRQDSYQINVSASPTFVAGSPVTFSGTNDLESITWTNAPISVLSFARDTLDQTSQAAMGGSWKGDALTLKTDVSYTKSYNSLFFSGLNLGSTAASFTQNQSGTVPSTSVSGTNLLDPANYKYASILYRARAYEGDLYALRFDGEYQLKDSFFDSLLAGVRYARRGANDAQGLIFADANVGNIPATTMPDYIMGNPYSNFFPGYSGVGNYLVGNLANARDAYWLRNAFGITTPIPGSNPLGTWSIAEETHTAYLMTKFMSRSVPLDGNAGLRVVRTHESVFGNQSVPSSSAIAPINVDSVYTDYLPSMNLRYELSDGLYLRGAASQTVSRPNFDQLSPSLTLVPNTVNPALNQGGAGNPELKPVRSNNLDVAVERYFNATTSVHLTGFLKKVDGFVTTVSSPEVHDGATYQVSRPQNSNTADIKGYEMGYQQFYDFLPGWLSGFGLQANYTYIDSETLNSTLGEKIPLQNLSRNSANIIGMYETGKLSIRVAYNWRDKFLSGVTNIVGVGSLPVYTKAYGWMDASVVYRLSKTVTCAIEGQNLLGTVRTSYYGVETRPQSVWINDKQISATLMVQF